MKVHKTQKGTELPIMNIKGKDYLEVKYRIIWFREEHPQCGVQTEIIQHSKDYSCVKATITTPSGSIWSQSHKTETLQGFPDHLEKAETSAIGRALALIGYGTQFTGDELAESDRLADSPVGFEPLKKEIKNHAPKREIDSNDLGNYEIQFGLKHKGKVLKEMDPFELDGYLKWLKDGALKKGKTLDGKALEFYEVAEAYLKSKEFGMDRAEINF